MTRPLLGVALAIALALPPAMPAAAADPLSAAAAPSAPKLDRRSLAPAPDYAMPRGGGTVSPARIADGGWQHCALTFDDGPNEITPRILEILDRLHVTATYFPIAATAARHPDVIRGFVAGGHEVGNHSLAHRNMAKLSAAAQRADLAEANRILRSLGATPTLFRPPYAAYDARLIETAHGLGLDTVLWSLDVRDWEIRDAGMLAARVNAGAGPALVVLLHATYSWTERALPDIIAALRGHGCRFVTLSAWLTFMRGGTPATTPIMTAAATPRPAAPPVSEMPAPPTAIVAAAVPPTPRTVEPAFVPAPITPVPITTEAAPSPPPPAVAVTEAAPTAGAPQPVFVAASLTPTPTTMPSIHVPSPPAPTIVAQALEPPRPTPPARRAPERGAAAAGAAPMALTLRPATLAKGAGNKTEFRIVGDDVFLTLGPDADLDAIAADIKAALERPRPPR